MTDQIQTEGMGDEDSKALFHIFFSIEWRVTVIWYIKKPLQSYVARALLYQ